MKKIKTIANLIKENCSDLDSVLIDFLLIEVNQKYMQEKNNNPILLNIYPDPNKEQENFPFAFLNKEDSERVKKLLASEHHINFFITQKDVDFCTADEIEITYHVETKEEHYLRERAMERSLGETTEELEILARAIEALPGNLQYNLRMALVEIDQAIQAKKLYIDSDEAYQLAQQILNNHGFKVDAIIPE